MTTTEQETPDAEKLCGRCKKPKSTHTQAADQLICPVIPTFIEDDGTALPLVLERLERMKERLRLAHSRINDLESVDLEEGQLRLALVNWYRLNADWPSSTKSAVEQEKEMTAATDALMKTIETIGLTKSATS